MRISTKLNNTLDWIAVTKHSTQVSGYAKLNEEQLRMMSEEVPGSAVELQAKDKVIIKQYSAIFVSFIRDWIEEIN